MEGMRVEYVIINDQDSHVWIVEVIIGLSLVVVLDSSIKDKFWLQVVCYLTFFLFCFILTFSYLHLFLRILLFLANVQKVVLELVHVHIYRKQVKAAIVYIITLDQRQVVLVEECQAFINTYRSSRP